MTISVSTSNEGIIVLTIQGEFTFGLHKPFREAYEKAAPRGSRYIVDLSQTSHIDSSALGMLLQMREYAGSGRESVRLINPHGTVAAALRTLNFDRLMVVDEAVSEFRAAARQ